MDIILAFAALGAIIIIGFISALAFEKTKIPDVIVLIIIGLIFGPIAIAFFNVEFVSTATLEMVAPYFTTLALVIILFDGGLNMSFERVLTGLWRTVFYAFTGFVLSLLIITVIAYLIFGFPLMISVLLGAVLGGVSSAVVFNLLRKMSIRDETRQLLSMESVISDVLCVVVVLAVILVLTGEGTGLVVATSLAKSFSIAIVVGLVFGILWLRTLSILKGKPFSFMITIGALLLLYSGVEFVEGSGLVAALVFGLVLGNKDEVARMFRIKSELVFEDRIREFHSEVSFLIKTIFFVYLGLSFTLDFSNIGIQSKIPFFTGYHGMIALLIIGIILIIVGIMVARYINMRISVALAPGMEVDKSVLSFVSARGLTAAALAALPFTIPAFAPTDPLTNPLYNPAYHSFIEPYQIGILNITFIIILVTVAITSIGIYWLERRRIGKTMEEVEKDSAVRKREKQVLKKWKAEEKRKRRDRIRQEDEMQKQAEDDKKKNQIELDSEIDKMK